MMETTGGWVPIYGEMRLVPLGVRRPRCFCPGCRRWFTVHTHEVNLQVQHCPYCGKEMIAHCPSCSHYRKRREQPYCKLDPDLFLSATLEACERYRNRNKNRADKPYNGHKVMPKMYDVTAALKRFLGVC